MYTRLTIFRLIQVIFYCLAFVAPMSALAGEGGGGGTGATKAVAPFSVMVVISKDDDPGCPAKKKALCDAILELIRKLLSSSYVLASTAAAPEPGNIQRNAESIFALLKQHSLLSGTQ